MALPESTSRSLARSSSTSLRVLAVNGQDPAIYERFEAIGHPLPVASVRISTGLRGRWIDRATDHIPTAAELAALCPGCGQSPCECDDTAVDLILEADALGLYSGGFDDSTEGWGA